MVKKRREILKSLDASSLHGSRANRESLNPDSLSDARKKPPKKEGED